MTRATRRVRYLGCTMSKHKEGTLITPKVAWPGETKKDEAIKVRSSQSSSNDDVGSTCDRGYTISAAGRPDAATRSARMSRRSRDIFSFSHFFHADCLA